METRQRRASSSKAEEPNSGHSTAPVLAVFGVLLFVFIFNAYKAPLMINYIREGQPYEVFPWKRAQERTLSRIRPLYLLLHLINAMASTIISGIILVTKDLRHLETLRWWRFVLHLAFSAFLLPNIFILGSNPIWVALILNGGPYIIMEFSRRFPNRQGDVGYLLGLLLAPAFEVSLIALYFLH